MGDTGPCGRCSEIHYFRGNEFRATRSGTDGRAADSTAAAIATSRSGTTSSWSSTARPDGTLQPLPAPSIDTGMGLERITAVIQGKLSNYDTDLFTPILDAIGAARRPAATAATLDDPSDVSMRVIADHLRAMTFLIADGVVPSNEWRGYVLRKIMRRAMRHGKKLGFTEPVLHDLVDVVVAEMGDALSGARRQNRDAIVRVVRSEEERFDAVLTAGLPRLEEALDRAAAAGHRRARRRGVPAVRLARRAARLHGGPRRPASARASTARGYDRAMEGQRAKARAGSALQGRRAGDHVDWRRRMWNRRSQRPETTSRATTRRP